LIVAFADGIFTYINTPDLSMEGNPLVSKFGLGWTALAIANIITFILFFALAYYSLFKYKTIYTTQTKFTAYCSQIIYDRPDMFWKGIIPKHICPYLAALGFAFPYSAIISRAIIVFEWIVYTFDIDLKQYFVFESKYCFNRLDIVVALILLFILLLYWFYKEFKKQLQNKNMNIKKSED
jgi:positive regulator of sigma E activity